MPAIGNMDVTLSVTTTPQQLYALLAAINPNAPRNVAKVNIQGDDANTDFWIIGDPNLSTARYSFKGQSHGDFFLDESQWDRNLISLMVIYIRSNTGTQTVHARVRTV